MRALAHPALVLAGAGAGVALAVVLTLIHRGAERGGATCRAALIPAYVPAHELPALVRGPRRPRMVVVNPASGPGPRHSEAYATAVRALQAAGVRVLGYVATDYGWRPLQAARADVGRYVAWYGVDGIFFDETASGAAQLGHYRALARAARDDGARLVVVNPGVPPAAGYFDLADVVVTFEGTYAAYVAAHEATPALDREPPDRAAHLIYGATRAQALGALTGSAAGYLYATSGALPNPWRTLPAYLDEEVEALATCG
jgi:hypothetical protein